MKTFVIVSTAVLAMLLGGTSRILSADEVKSVVGNVRVLKVKGTVTISIAGNPHEALKEGAFVQQKQEIQTAKDSQAWLLFSNGTTVTIQPNSIFSVDKFLQTPFDSDKVDYTKVKSEPSISQTKISVNEGSIIADVAKLKKDSTFQIGTPVGVAGIRGTLIQVTVNTTAGGSVSVTVNLPEGLSDFAATNGRTFTLSNGQTITVTSDPVTHTMTLGNVSPLAAQTVQQIQSLAQEVATAIPAQKPFEGVPQSAPEKVGGTTTPPLNSAGGFGGDTGAGNVGTAPGGGGSGGGGGGGGGGGTPTPTPRPTPTPNPPPS